MVKKRFAAAVTVASAAFSIFGRLNNANQSPQATQSATAATEGSITKATAGRKASSDVDASADRGGEAFGATYWIESDFLRTVADLITPAAEADGNRTVVAGAQQDSTKQIQIIEDFIAQDVDAVFLNPVDRDAVAPTLQKLREARIPVINFDSSVASLNLVDAYVAIDDLQAGKLCAEAMIKGFPRGGLIVVLNYPANSAYLDREKGFLETIEGKSFEVAATFDAEDTAGKGQDITSDILQAHPDTIAIFSINDQAGMDACAACATSGANVSIYDVDDAPEAEQVVAKEGSIYRTAAAQSPIKIDTDCYNVAMTILSGEKPAQFQTDVPAFTIDSTNIQGYLDTEWQQNTSSGRADSGMSTRANEGRIKQ